MLFFTDLLTTYAEKFARSKGLRLRSTPLEFGGFYLDRNIGNGYGEMRKCSLEISFNKMLGTCSHELAHYIQLVKWGRSSCESNLVLKSGKYDGELAKEHEEFAKEI